MGPHSLPNHRSYPLHSSSEFFAAVSGCDTLTSPAPRTWPICLVWPTPRSQPRSGIQRLTQKFAMMHRHSRADNWCFAWHRCPNCLAIRPCCLALIGGSYTRCPRCEQRSDPLRASLCAGSHLPRKRTRCEKGRIGSRCHRRSLWPSGHLIANASILRPGRNGTNWVHSLPT